MNTYSGDISDGDYEVLDEFFKWSRQLPIFKLDLIGMSRSDSRYLVRF